MKVNIAMSVYLHYLGTVDLCFQLLLPVLDVEEKIGKNFILFNSCNSYYRNRL